MKLETFFPAAIDGELVSLLFLDPARVKIWTGNARVYERLTGDNTRELVTSIGENGQQAPVIVRQVENDADYDYELIAGSRRHFAVSWLRANDVPTRLLARISNLDDEAAFGLSDAENRLREDVSDLERARSYAWAVKAIYADGLGAMALKLGISKSWLSKMIAVSKIPDTVIAAFASPFDVKVKPAYVLAQALGDEERAAKILKAAKKLAQEQVKLRENGKAGITPAAVYDRLFERELSPPAPDIISWGCEAGAKALTLQEKSDAGLLIRVHAKSGATTDELVAAFRDALAYLEKAD